MTAPTMTQRYEAITQTRRRLVGLMAKQAVATSELTTELLKPWVEASVRTAQLLWTPPVTIGVAARRSRTAVTATATVAAERTVAAASTEAKGSTSAEQDATADVVFRLPSDVNAGSAHLVGDFNDWSTTADPMNRRPDGSFELTKTLPVGRQWRFRYLLDGERWENDWAADDYAHNGFGDDDSIVDLGTSSQSQLVGQN